MDKFIAVWIVVTITGVVFFFRIQADDECVNRKSFGLSGRVEDLATTANGTKNAGDDVHMVSLSLVNPLKAANAACLDGTLPGYHLDRGTGSGSSSWLVNLEGGGWCNTATSCNFRKRTRLGSSKCMEEAIPFTGILSNQKKENPDFHTWNRVRVRYCDGASFSGSGISDNGQIHFNGEQIWRVVMAELHSKGMASATQALLSGCSAGGLSTILHCDEFRRYFSESTRVRCMADAGLFLNTLDVSGNRTIQKFFAGVVKLQGVGRNLPKTCTEKLDPALCFFAENLIAGVQTPLFLLNAAYDSWQVIESIAPSSADPHGEWNKCKYDFNKCSSSQLQILQGFRNEMMHAVDRFSAQSRNGLFMNSCFAHCQSERQETWFSEDSPRLNDKRIATAVGDWYFDRAEVKFIDCAFPCDSTCHNLVFRNR